jgi:hypothetical protein
MSASSRSAWIALAFAGCVAADVAREGEGEDPAEAEVAEAALWARGAGA